MLASRLCRAEENKNRSVLSGHAHFETSKLLENIDERQKHQMFSELSKILEWQCLKLSFRMSSLAAMSGAYIDVDSHSRPACARGRNPWPQYA